MKEWYRHVRIGICEQSEQARLQLMRWVEQYGTLYGCKFALAAYSAASDLFNAMAVMHFDLVLMCGDGPEGFLKARSLRETYPATRLVFITDTPQYAVMGVRIHLTDYIVKPAEFKNIARALKLAGIGRGG